MSRVALRKPLVRREFLESGQSSFHLPLRSAQKAAAACLAGLGLASICFWGFDPGVAAELARNADSPLDFILHQASPRTEPAPRAASVAADARNEAPVKHKERRSIKLASTSTVCVRLCDGYFFPAENAAACGALCPGAPTEAFFQPPGADGIDMAISSAGQKYTALPNAYRYRAAFDEICSCHGERVNASLLALSDPTLRKGDVVMTQAGMKVFRGGGSLKDANAFLSLAKATMPSEKRSILLAMEKASTPQRAKPAPDRAPLAAKAPRHIRTAALRWPPVAPRAAVGSRAVWPQRSGYRGYDFDEAYW